MISIAFPPDVCGLQRMADLHLNSMGSFVDVGKLGT
jgi:hypothetical protein